MPQVSKTTIETPVPEGTRHKAGVESSEPEKTLEAATAKKMTLPPQPQFSGEKVENESFE